MVIHQKIISFKEISLFVAHRSLSRCIYWAIGRRLSYVRKIISSELHILLTTAVFCDATALAYILETMSPVSLSRCNVNESFWVDVSGSWLHLYSWNRQTVVKKSPHCLYIKWVWEITSRNYIIIQFLLLFCPRWLRHYLTGKDQKETTVSTCQACG